jgi:hypothetical protein
MGVRIYVAAVDIIHKFLFPEIQIISETSEKTLKTVCHLLKWILKMKMKLLTAAQLLHLIL